MRTGFFSGFVPDEEHRLFRDYWLRPVSVCRTTPHKERIASQGQGFSAFCAVIEVNILIIIITIPKNTFQIFCIKQCFEVVEIIRWVGNTSQEKYPVGKHTFIV